MPPPANLLSQFRKRPHGNACLRWSPLDGPEELIALASRRRIDVMIVLAGIVPGPDARLADDPRIADACLAAAAATGISRCLVASSSAIYGPGQGERLREDDPACASSEYGKAKLATEAVCNAWRERGLAVTALRIGNVAGADALLGQDKARSGEEIRLDRFLDGGGPVRSYIDPITLAGVVGALAGAEELPPVLNVAAPGDVAMADLLDAAGLPWRWQDAPPSALQRLVLDCDRLASIHALPADAAAPRRIVDRWREATA